MSKNFSKWEISAEEAFKLDSTTTIFIDLREDYEFQDKHMDLTNLFNFPFSNFHKEYKRIPLDKTVVLVSIMGQHSEKAFELLNVHQNKKVFILSGGIMSWASEGLPMVSNPDELPEDIFGPHECSSCKGCK